MDSFDIFVEKIVRHHKLLTDENLEKAKTYKSNRPHASLLDILVKSELLEQHHAELILKKFREFRFQRKVVPQTPKQESVSKKSSELHLKSVSLQPSKTKPEEKTCSTEPAFSKMKEFLDYTRKIGASDLHINADAPPLVRKDGHLRSLDGPPLSSEETEKLIFGILSKEQQENLQESSSLDTCLTIEGLGRYRICIIKQRSGWDASFRVINAKAPTFNELGLPDVLRRLTEYHEGLVLIAGPSGSGKSSTLAAMVELINRTRDEHIITLEDPIEYVFEPAKSHISQRQVGSHTRDFSSALRAVLREDPDIIVIGELRDLETASLAITASETGHLVFTTLHTSGAEQTLYRLLDFFPPNQQQQIRSMVSESLRGIVCQRLIPRREKEGRVLALEIMINIPAIGNLIREDRLYQLTNTMKIHHTLGMKLLDDSIQELLKTKIVDPTEAYYAVVDQMIFLDREPKKMTTGNRT